MEDARRARRGERRTATTSQADPLPGIAPAATPSAKEATAAAAALGAARCITGTTGAPLTGHASGPVAATVVPRSPGTASCLRTSAAAQA